MQIYSSPVLGLDLTHPAGSVREGGVFPVSVGQTRLLHIENWFSTLFRKPLSFTCHINSCPSIPVSNAGINLSWFCCHCTETSAWLNCENDVLYHIACVNECRIQAIKWSFSQLYQVSITVIVRVNTGVRHMSPLYKGSLSFCCYSAVFAMMADVPEVTTPLWRVCLWAGAWQES